MTTDINATVYLDVRPVLAAGEEPFDLILETTARVPDGGALELLAPFEPVPLYGVLAGRGFVARAEELDDGDWVVRFTRVAIAPEMSVTEMHQRYPATTSVLATHGMDLCCGGHLSLEHVAEAHRVPLEDFLRELTNAVAIPPSPAPQSGEAHR